MAPLSHVTPKKNRLDHWQFFDTVVTIIAVFVCFITIYPMWYVICMSISDPIAANAGLVTFWPVGFTTNAYTILLEDQEFWRSFGNSILYVIANCFLMLFNTVALAYPLTRKNLWGRKWINFYLLVTMYFGGGMIPSFIVNTQLGLYNNPLVMVLPGYSVWNAILMRTFLKSLPDELAEAAFIDGATNMQALRKIYLPLSKPVIAVIMIYTIVGVWNSWFGAMLYLPNKDWHPVQLVLRNILISQNAGMRNESQMMTEEIQKLLAEQAMSARQIKYSMIVVVTLPIIAVYPMFQKHFTKGVMLGSLKG